MKTETKRRVILAMREAIFDGYSFEDFCSGSTCISKKNAKKLWRTAEILTNDWNAWGNYLMQTEVKPAFESFLKAFDTYYNEGCLSNQHVQNNLKIDEESIKVLLGLIGA